MLTDVRQSMTLSPAHRPWHAHTRQPPPGSHSRPIVRFARFVQTRMVWLMANTKFERTIVARRSDAVFVAPKQGAAQGERAQKRAKLEA